MSKDAHTHQHEHDKLPPKYQEHAHQHEHTVGSSSPHHHGEPYALISLRARVEDYTRRLSEAQHALWKAEMGV